jgi:homoaconitate hydratase family protein
VIAQSMTHKILARASGKAHVVAGEIIEADIDFAFTHDPVLDGLRRVFYAEFGSGAKVWDPDRIALFQDHLVPAKDAESRRLARVMDSFAFEQGIRRYYPYGKNYGVCHIVMCENAHARPGEIVLGTDSHSVTFGAFNAFGTGVGMVDMVNVFRTGRLWFRVPETIEVRIDGELRDGVVAKDVILKLIGEIGMDGATGKTIELTGTTIAALSAEERMTLCNMTVEAGAKNGIMALNATARAYLDQIEPGLAAQAVTTDPGFEYARTIHYRAGEIAPQVAFPHQPDNVHSIDEAKRQRIRVNQVYVGSCTGAKYEDIALVARTLDGGQISDHVQLMIVPATMAIYRRLVETGLTSALVAAGAVVESPGCKACYGAHGGVGGDGEVCLATINRNFKGRMGNPKSLVYLASPYVAAKTALAGFITD